MSKKSCGPFIVSLLFVCVLSSCDGEKKQLIPTGSEPPVEPPTLTKSGHCLQVTAAPIDDKEYEYRYCYYPYDKADVSAGRYRCSTDVKNCIQESGECAKAPGQQKQPC